jgi:hypothetical protein
VLEAATERLQRESSAGTWASLAPTIPDLLADLHHHVAGAGRHRAAPLLILALTETHWIAKCFGDLDLAWLIADRARQAAQAHDDPALFGLAEFTMAQSLVRAGARARRRAALVAGRAAEGLQSQVGQLGPAAEVYGALHMAAAWADTLTGRLDVADDHLAVAGDLAARTGDRTAYRLWFGPGELAILRAAIAVERGEGGRVDEVVRGVEPHAMPSRVRQADYYIQVGRGLAQESTHRSRAVLMLQRADRLAPMRTRMDPFVRATVDRLLYEAGGHDLRQMARRMGLISR